MHHNIVLVNYLVFIQRFVFFRLHSWTTYTWFRAQSSSYRITDVLGVHISVL